MIERFTKLCETLGEYLCSYCVYQGRLGHCRYYNGSYTLNGDDGMTVNKRYFKEDFYNEYAIKKEDIIIAVVDSGSNARRICNELNALHGENEQLKQDVTDTNMANSILQERVEHYRKENEQLKQRNDRQCNQLKQLWELIEDEDYNTLRSMLNQRETDEKLLQKEWGTYSD